MADDTLGRVASRAARRRSSPRIGLAVRASCAAIAFLILLGSGYAWALYQDFTNSIPHGSPVPELAKGQKDADGSDQNILLVGNDSRAGATRAEELALSTGDSGGSVNTDSMMVLHVPANGSKPTVISFPRDSWVSIPGNGKGKLNSAYGDGYAAAKNAHRSETAAQSAGLIMTIKTLDALTGLHIDHYMQVNLLGFYRISNAIGGVPVCLKKAQNASTDADARHKGYSGIDLPAGVSVIKGKQALAFVRQRHGLPNGDLDRIKRQQYFLASAFHEVTSAGSLLNPFKLHDLLAAVGSSLLTDPSLDLLSLAHSLELLSSGDITFATLPNDGAQLIYPDGVATSIVQVDTAAIPGFIRRVRGEAADPDLGRAQPAAPGSVTLDVLNGTQIFMLATRNGDQLKKLGFKVDVVDSTDNPITATIVQYPPGNAAGAKAVAAVVKGAELVETTTVSRVTLELGTDGKQVSGLAADTATPSNDTTATTTAPSHSGGLGCIN